MERNLDVDRVLAEHAKYLSDQGQKIFILTEGQRRHDERITLAERAIRDTELRVAREEERDKATAEHRRALDEDLKQIKASIAKNAEVAAAASQSIEGGINAFARRVLLAILAMFGTAMFAWFVAGGAALP